MPRAHVALQTRLTDCLEGRIVSDPREVPYYRRILGLDGGPWRESANYQAMLVASWVWRVELESVLFEERRLAMAQVRRLYALEREQGMLRGECLCPDPHAGMHLEAHAAILCLGFVFGLRELQDLAVDWLGRALRLYHALASPDGEPWAPGLRVRTEVPRNQAAAALLREVLGLPHRRQSGRIVTAKELATPGTSRGPFYYGALRWLLAMLRDTQSVRAKLHERATSGPFPHKLLLPLRVVRFDRGLLASLEQTAPPPRNGWLHPVDWLLVRWGRPGKHEARVGRNWQTPAPEIPGEALVVG